MLQKAKGCSRGFKDDKTGIFWHERRLDVPEKDFLAKKKKKRKKKEMSKEVKSESRAGSLNKLDV